jgi:hypothetical protein
MHDATAGLGHYRHVFQSLPFNLAVMFDRPVLDFA